MSVPLRLRLLEWFADSSPRIQYPRPVKDAEFHWFRWQYAMPLWQRLAMVLLGLFALTCCALLLAGLGVVTYAFLIVPLQG